MPPGPRTRSDANSDPLSGGTTNNDDDTSSTAGSGRDRDRTDDRENRLRDDSNPQPEPETGSETAEESTSETTTTGETAEPVPETDNTESEADTGDSSPQSRSASERARDAASRGTRKAKAVKDTAASATNRARETARDARDAARDRASQERNRAQEEAEMVRDTAPVISDTDTDAPAQRGDDRLEAPGGPEETSRETERSTPQDTTETGSSSVGAAGGVFPETRNRSSDSLPSMEDRLEARVARGDENIDPEDIDVERRDELYAPGAQQHREAAFSVSLTDGEQPAGRVATPGDGPDLRNQSSDGLPDVEARLKARAARGNENIDPGDLEVERREEMYAPEAGQHTEQPMYSVSLTDEAEARLRAQAESEQGFGDRNWTDTLSNTAVFGEDADEFWTSAAEKTGFGDAADPVEAGVNATGDWMRERTSDVAEAVSEHKPTAMQDTADNLHAGPDRGSATENFIQGAGAVLNVPDTVSGVMEGIEYGEKAVTETKAGRGGEFAAKSYDAGAAAAEAAKDEFTSNPIDASARAVGSLVVSAGVMGGAARVSSTAGTATRFAIQPGEELASGAATRVARRSATGRRALDKIPGGRIDNEEIMIAAGRKAADKVRSGAGRARSSIDTSGVGSRVRQSLESRSRADSGILPGRDAGQKFASDTRGQKQLTRTRTRDEETESDDSTSRGRGEDETTATDAREAYEQELEEDAAQREHGMSREELDAELDRMRRQQQLQDVRATDIELENRTSGIGDLRTESRSTGGTSGFDTSRLQTERARLAFEQETQQTQGLALESEAGQAQSSRLVGQESRGITSEVAGLQSETAVDTRVAAATESQLGQGTQVAAETGAQTDLRQDVGQELLLESEVETEGRQEWGFESEMEREAEVQTEFDSEWEFEVESEVEFESERERESEPFDLRLNKDGNREVQAGGRGSDEELVQEFFDPLGGR